MERSDREEPRATRRGKKPGAMVSEETATPIGSASSSRNDPGQAIRTERSGVVVTKETAGKGTTRTRAITRQQHHADPNAIAGNQKDEGATGHPRDARRADRQARFPDTECSRGFAASRSAPRKLYANLGRADGQTMPIPSSVKSARTDTENPRLRRGRRQPPGRTMRVADRAATRCIRHSANNERTRAHCSAVRSPPRSV